MSPLYTAKFCLNIRNVYKTKDNQGTEPSFSTCIVATINYNIKQEKCCICGIVTGVESLIHLEVHLAGRVLNLNMTELSRNGETITLSFQYSTIKRKFTDQKSSLPSSVLELSIQIEVFTVTKTTTSCLLGYTLFFSWSTTKINMFL